MKKNINYISFLQFIGPIFVVLGHSLNGIPANDILLKIKEIIYVFHMPLFFFISAYLFANKYKKEKINYQKFYIDKFWSLMFPYLVLNAIFLVPKMILDSYLVDNVTFSFQYFISTIIEPRNSILGHLWFLVALYIIYIFTPLLIKVVKKNDKVIWSAVFLITFIISVNPVETYLFALSDLSKDIFFFFVGLYLGCIDSVKIIKFFKNKIIISITFITTALILFNYIKFGGVILSRTLCLFTLILLMTISVNSEDLAIKVKSISKYSYSIYILHWPLMLTCRIILYQILKLDKNVVILLMIISGYFGSLLVIYIINLLQVKLNIKNRYFKYIIGI